jgi:hypothetical protein
LLRDRCAECLSPRFYGVDWQTELNDAFDLLAGKLADLIVVAANPLEDITNLRRLQLVLKEGRVVSDKRLLSGAVP